MSRFLLCLIVAGFTPSLPLSGAEMTSDESQQVERLVHDLSEGNYKMRVAAEDGLKKSSRGALPTLKQYETSRDPEVRERIRNVVEFIRTDPGQIPEKVFTFNSIPHETWISDVEQWTASAKACAKNLDGHNGAAGSFAQSFVPRCQTIQAVKLAVYPIGNGGGWICLDVREDEQGHPGKYVLGRSWVHVNQSFSVPPTAFTVFNLPEMTVNENATYWLCFAEFPDVGRNRESITNHLFSDDNPYADGLEWRHDYQPSRGTDAVFTVFSQAKEPPQMIRPATDEELKTLPSLVSRTMEWKVTENDLRGGMFLRASPLIPQ
jgi:hypothetical protein